MASQLFRWVKINAGKERYVLSISGLVIVVFIAWVVGALFMPKNKEEQINKQLLGLWYTKRDSGFMRMEIKNSGYFYFNNFSKKGKSFFHKGIITHTIKDTFLLLSFNIDTLLYHKIMQLDKKILQLKNLKDTSIINFIKQ